MNMANAELAVTVPLSFSAHSLAQKFCSSISNPQKAQQVYLNTLAVYAVEHYLRCLGFETDWQGSDSYNPLILRLMDVADLKIKQLGKLECRPVLPGAESCEIPPEVRADRIGYVAVQLEESLKQASILGFIRNPADQISLSQLQSVEDFLVYLTNLEQVQSVPVVQLGKWFEGIMSTGWQQIDELLNPLQLGVAFKQEISIVQGRKIDLGMELHKLAVALVVKLASTNAKAANILIQLHPLNDIILPAGVQLIVNDASGQPVDQATSRKQDNWIQLEISAESGESFSVTAIYQEKQVTQNFVL